MHILNPEVTKMGYIIMVYYIGTGLFLGIITLMDDGMELALGFHAANNLIGALLVTSDWSVFQTHSIFKDMSEPSAGADVILPVVIVYPILLFIFSNAFVCFCFCRNIFRGKIYAPSNAFIGNNRTKKSRLEQDFIFFPALGLIFCNQFSGTLFSISGKVCLEF